MKIKCYTCECGEGFYEDDEECQNCGAPVDQSEFKIEECGEITSQGPIELVEIPLIK